MRLWKRLSILAAGLAVLATGALALALRHELPCPASGPPEPTGGMRAIVQRCYGATDVLRLVRIEKPVPGHDEVLVRVRAASVNPLDWHHLTGTPYVMRLGAGIGAPSEPRVGVDFAGTVEAVGRDVRRFRPGDAVFGGRTGALAEYVVVREDRAIAHKPDNASFEQAAAIPVAAITALQGLRDHGGLRAGQKVLVNGASGGVGTFGVQIAKAMGAEVTAVCSTRNVALVRALGADHVIDYTRADFTRDARRYDVILDNVGNHGLMATRRALAPGGTLVVVGGPKHDRWLGPLSRAVRASLLSAFVDERLATFFADLDGEDLASLAGMVRDGRLTPVVERTYALAETADAFRHVETGRARGKVVVRIE